MKIIKILCKNCNKEFDALKKEVNRGNSKFCSKSCSSKYRFEKLRKSKKDNCICAYCGKPFFKYLSKFKNSKHGYFFCCREHKDLAQRIDGIKNIQPNHYTNHNCSYRDYALRELPNLCNRCGYNKSIKILVVHHKDRNRKNNMIDNLEILCPNCHCIEHYDSD